MSKGNNLQSLFCGILFCISVSALIIACLAFTKKDNDSTVTNGGRVVSVTSYGKDIESSLKISYESIENISFDKMYFRKFPGRISHSH